MDILDLLRSDGSIVINKKLSHKIGVLENIMLSELISQYKYFQNQDKLTEDGYFYCTIKKMEKQTAIKRRNQSKALNNLIKNGLIDKQNKGIPAKRHFKIYPGEIIKLLDDINEIIKSHKPDNDRKMEDFYEQGYR